MSDLGRIIYLSVAEKCEKIRQRIVKILWCICSKFIRGSATLILLHFVLIKLVCCAAFRGVLFMGHGVVKYRPT